MTWMFNKGRSRQERRSLYSSKIENVETFRCYIVIYGYVTWRVIVLLHSMLRVLTSSKLIDCVWACVPVLMFSDDYDCLPVSECLPVSMCIVYAFCWLHWFLKSSISHSSPHNLLLGLSYGMSWSNWNLVDVLGSYLLASATSDGIILNLSSLKCIVDMIILPILCSSVCWVLNNIYLSIYFCS